MRRLSDPELAEIFVSKVRDVYDKASSSLEAVLGLTKGMQSNKEGHWWKKLDKPTDLECVINMGKECFDVIDGDALEPAVAALDQAIREILKSIRVLDTHAIFPSITYGLCRLLCRKGM